jgi:polyphosphate kinase 2
MGKKNNRALADATEAVSDTAEDGKLSRKDYEKELSRLHGELVALQEWVKHAGLKVCILFEGRDGAGKGGTIKAIMERVSPRTFRVLALPAPSDREKSQMYLQRYLPYLPAAGEIVIFDRSWYNRAGVERVMGFCTEEQARTFLDAVPAVEKAIVGSGVILIKFWMEVGEEEQTRRMEERINDPRKIWKLSPMDLESYKRWYDYSRARDEMFEKTDSPWAPWYVVPSDNKRKARLNVIRHLLKLIPFEEVKREKIELPKRQKRGDYQPSRYMVKTVEQIY